MRNIKRTMKVVVVLPAYNAERTLLKTFADIPKDLTRNVILVDDKSRDNTVSVAKKLGIKVFTHSQNRGYGGNQKTCYTMALSEGAGVVVMLHPDYQYDPKLMEDMVKPIVEGRCEIMLGSRIRSREEALKAGMPLYKYLGNRFLTIFENMILGRNLSEYHTGYRAYLAKSLAELPFHKFSDDFVFDQQILVSAIREKYRIGEIAVPVKYFKEASSINWHRSVKYGMETLITLGWYMLDTWHLYRHRMFK